jgi:hypothetical protein
MAQGGMRQQGVFNSSIDSSLLYSQDTC